MPTRLAADPTWSLPSSLPLSQITLTQTFTKTCAMGGSARSEQLCDQSFPACKSALIVSQA